MIPLVRSPSIPHVVSFPISDVRGGLSETVSVVWAEQNRHNCPAKNRPSSVRKNRCPHLDGLTSKVKPESQLRSTFQIGRWSRFSFGRVIGHCRERSTAAATLQLIEVQPQQISRMMNEAAVRALPCWHWNVVAALAGMRPQAYHAVVGLHLMS